MTETSWAVIAVLALWAIGIVVVLVLERKRYGK